MVGVVSLKAAIVAVRSVFLAPVSGVATLVGDQIMFVTALLALLRGGRHVRTTAALLLAAGAVELLGERASSDGKPAAQWYLAIQVCLAAALAWRAWRFRERDLLLVAGLQAVRVAFDMEAMQAGYRAPWSAAGDLAATLALAMMVGLIVARDWLGPPRAPPLRSGDS